MTDSADFYDCSDPDTLSHTDADEAIEYYLNDCGVPLPSEVTAKAYVRKVIDDADKRGYKAALLEILYESINEEYGDPDGNTDEGRDDEVEAAAQALVDLVVKKYRVWPCEHTPKLDVTVKTAEWIRKNNPEWLEGNDELLADVEQEEQEEQDE